MFWPSDEQHAAYKLLTCSKTQDRSIIVWEPDKTSPSGMWLEVARLGEVGGNMEGYYSCQFNSTGSEVLGCSYQVRILYFVTKKSVVFTEQDGFWEDDIKLLFLAIRPMDCFCLHFILK